MGSEEKYSEDSQILREIVNYPEIPSEIMSFWDRLTRSSQNGEARNMISVLNGMSQRGLPKGIDFIAWYEIFRDIYIMRAREQESQTMPVKVPRFTTFDRSFEQLAFLPEFWFGKPKAGNGIKQVLKQSEAVIVPSDLLLSFERYMYNQEGGACWSALDWAMAKYCFRVVCEPAKEENPLLKIASLLLAAHYIANGKMGLYISERADVELPYIGISSGGKNGSSLLKYFHFDRFTRFSFIREHELDLDADKQSLCAMLEPQWQSLAAMTEFILQNKAARATRTTCTRVGFNSFISALNQLRSENALGSNSILKARIDCALELLDSPDFASIPPAKLLQEIDLHFNIISCNYYLHQQGIETAEQFWQIARAVFNEIQKDYEGLYYSTVEKFTAEEYARSANALIQDDCTFLMQSLKGGNLNELCGRLKGKRLRSALKTLLMTEQLEWNCGQLDQILNNEFNQEKLLLYLPSDWRELALPREWLITDVTAKQAAATLRCWANEILSEFTRDPKTGVIVRDFTKLDMAVVQQASDRLWEIYFSKENEDICRDRWMLSLSESIQILETNTEKLRGVTLPLGKTREQLLDNNRTELKELSGSNKFNSAAIRERLAAFDSYTLGNVRQGYLRSLIIMDLIARLMTTTSRIASLEALWSCPEELEPFFTHLLCASGGDLKLPFPFHVGIYSDSLLRLSRNGNQDQRDAIHRLLNHKYDNCGERYIFILMLLKYLKQTDNPHEVLDSITQNPVMAEYASRDRLKQLKDYLGGK